MIIPSGQGSVKYAYKLSSIGCMCCCLLVVIISAVILGSTNSKFDTWIETTGTVTDVLSCENTSNNNDENTYQPQIEYIPVDGGDGGASSNTVITAETNVCSSIVNYEIGDEIDIVYDPNNLDQIRTQSFVNNLGLVMSIVVGIGSFFFCISCCVFVVFSGMLGGGGQGQHASSSSPHQQQNEAGIEVVPVYSGGGTSSTAGPITAYK